MKDFFMVRFNNVLWWIFTTSLILFAVFFSFYIITLLIPIFLAMAVISGFAMLALSWYKQYKKKTTPVCPLKTTRKRKNSEIIDAEYEVIDNGK